MKSINKGFTLIELLVVITIIGILATGAVTVFTSQIQKARDTTRINDIKALQTAVEQTYQDNAAYPHANPMGTPNSISFFTGAVDDYIELVPEDTKFGQGCRGANEGCGYIYAVADDSGITNGRYELSTAFEAEGTVKSRASSGADNGQDNDRFELGIDVLNLITSAPAPGTSSNEMGSYTNCDYVSSIGSGVLILSRGCNTP